MVPNQRFNVFWGDNGQGKTNLLEAIYVLGCLRSFRASRLRELIAFDSEVAYVRGTLFKDGLERNCRVGIHDGRKEVRLDGKTPRPLTAYFGQFNVVIFAPEDLLVLRGSPGERRRFLDRATFHWDPTFLPVAQRYQKILSARNALLKADQFNGAMLDVYSEQLVVAGHELMTRRQEFLRTLEPHFAEAFEQITGGALRASLRYDACTDDLEASLRKDRGRDRARGTTSSGPHVDELTILLDDQPSRAYASQGQLRALVLAWKIAEMKLLSATRGQPPILLLDDVSSELDPQRTKYLFDFLSLYEGQCFVTTTHADYIPIRENREDFQIVKGRVGGLKAVAAAQPV